MRMVQPETHPNPSLVVRARVSAVHSRNGESPGHPVAADLRGQPCRPVGLVAHVVTGRHGTHSRVRHPKPCPPTGRARTGADRASSPCHGRGRGTPATRCRGRRQRSPGHTHPSVDDRPPSSSAPPRPDTAGRCRARSTCRHRRRIGRRTIGRTVDRTLGRTARSTSAPRSLTHFAASAGLTANPDTLAAGIECNIG